MQHTGPAAFMQSCHSGTGSVSWYSIVASAPGNRRSPLPSPLGLCAMGSVTEDWELTSRRAASEATSEDGVSQEHDQGFPAVLPSPQELLAAIESHSSSSGDPDAAIPRGSAPAAADADAAAGPVATHSVPDAAPASVTTTLINEVLENGHRPEVQPQQQQPRQQLPEDLARAKFWDKQIAAGQLSMLPEITIMHVNIMAWGESGLGKTTFIKNLVQGWGLASMGEAFQSGGRTSPEQFRANPTSMRLETQPIIDKGANKGLVISIQDMPGWGDEIDLVSNLKTVVQFLLEQRKKDLVDNKAGVTESHPCPGTVMKHGITVCLYFLPPQRAKEMDWYMLEGISSLVAVVPVIAKADTHTAPELEAYRKEVLEVIERATSKAAAAGSDATSRSGTTSSNSACSLISPFKPYCFDPADLDAVQAVHPMMPPFAIMGSQVLLGPEDSSFGPEGAPYRRYLWGMALPLDRDHSDLIILKQLLTGHQNRAVYGLLNDSWKRAHAFFKCYEHLKRVQLEAKIAKGELSASPAAILGAVEGLDVDMSPLVAEVCGSVSSFGGGQQQLQDRLRCEEQHRLASKLQQALSELKDKKKSEVKLWQLRVAVVLAFMFGVLLALAVAGAYMGWGFGGEAAGTCGLGASSAASGSGPQANVNGSVFAEGLRRAAAAPPVAGPARKECFWKWQAQGPGHEMRRVHVCSPL